MWLNYKGGHGCFFDLIKARLNALIKDPLVKINVKKYIN